MWSITNFSRAELKGVICKLISYLFFIIVNFNNNLSTDVTTIAGNYCLNKDFT